MEHNKDIGTMIQETMEQGTMTPKASLWDRIDNSLEERRKKKRSALWFWYGGAGVLLVMLLALWGSSNGSMYNDDTTIPTTSEMVVEDIAEDQDLTSTQNTLKNYSTKDGLPLDTIQNKENTTNKEITIKNTQEVNTNVTDVTRTKKISEAPSKKRVITDSGFTIKTKHQYYNSDLDTTVVSANKQKIDSLVLANKRIMAIKDSIARARAADSIKLNEATLDSIPK